MCSCMSGWTVNLGPDAWRSRWYHLGITGTFLEESYKGMAVKVQVIQSYTMDSLCCQ